MPATDAQENARRPLRRFAPLNPEKAKSSGERVLKGIVFDVDGTLWYVRVTVNKRRFTCWSSVSLPLEVE